MMFVCAVHDPMSNLLHHFPETSHSFTLHCSDAESLQESNVCIQMKILCFLLSFRYKIYNCSWHCWGPQTNPYAIFLRQVVFNSRLNQKKSVCLPQLELMLVQDLLAHCALCLTSFLLSFANLVWNNSLVSKKSFLAIQWGKGIYPKADLKYRECFHRIYRVM